MNQYNQNSAGIIEKIVRKFLTGPLSIILIISALALGISAILLTPREEEPQIAVPMIAVNVEYPGHTPKEVEQHVTRPLERILWQIEGVEHVYSVSDRDSAHVTVRFYVGENREESLVKVRDKMQENMDLVPPDVKNWNVKTLDVDDVPIVTLSFLSPEKTPFELRRIVEEVRSQLDWLKNIYRVKIFGGYKRQIKIYPDIENMAAMNVTLKDIKAAIEKNNRIGNTGKTYVNNKQQNLILKKGLASVKDVKNTIVKYGQLGIIRVEDIAKVEDGPEEPHHYVNIGFGPSAKNIKKEYKKKSFPAVTLAFSKKPDTNAVNVADNIIKEAKELQDEVIPNDIKMIVTRNYGETANEKVNNLLYSLLFAIITVVLLITFTLGRKEGLVVGLAVPISFALALFVNYLLGYTINRVTLFALILSLGLVVDDPITNVDNINRHIHQGKKSAMESTLFAVNEVIPPIIMSTIAIIISFIPMFFITGMMGPYMSPMAINVPLTVIFSTICALTFVPWMSFNLLKNNSTKIKSQSEKKKESSSLRFIRRIYHRAMNPFLEKRKAYILIITIIFLFIACSLLLLVKVPLKMLPFDNNNKLQLVLDMPEDTSLEKTANTTYQLGNYLKKVKEVKDFEIYTGINSPIDFNGLVRHYQMRKKNNNADIRINLKDKSSREYQSHAIALKIRDKLTKIAEKNNGELKIVEAPPGPPVLSTLTVEIYGDKGVKYSQLIDATDKLESLLKGVDSKNIAEIDDMAETKYKETIFDVNKEKAATNGIYTSDILKTLKTAINGERLTALHDKDERTPLYAFLQLPLEARADTNRLGQLWLPSRNDQMESSLVQLAELGEFRKIDNKQPIYHKDLNRVVFFTAETIGRPPGEMILETLFKSWERPIKNFFNAIFFGEWQSNITKNIKAEWGGEGEWQITVRVFRDLGIAFAAALIGIYMLLIIQTSSFLMPLIIMSAIPLTIIGIAPGFYLLNIIAGDQIAGYQNPVFFTATAMIGMIALGGIVIRNSVVLIDFIENALKDGKKLEEAILESGSVRFRPIVLTAITTMVGAVPITLDPVFSGLAWALIFGLIASTLFTLLVVPTIYYLVKKQN